MTYFVKKDPRGNEAYMMRTETGYMMFIADPANTDYQAYLAWVAEGNAPVEWSPDAD